MVHSKVLTFQNLDNVLHVLLIDIKKPIKVISILYIQILTTMNYLTKVENRNKMIRNIKNV